MSADPREDTPRGDERLTPDEANAARYHVERSIGRLGQTWAGDIELRILAKLEAIAGEVERETIEDLVAQGRCPHCGTLQGIWHKMGCPLDKPSAGDQAERSGARNPEGPAG